MDIQTQATCDATLTAAEFRGSIRRGMVCAGEASREPCFGDWGGPLSRVVGTQHVHVGTRTGVLCGVNVSICVRYKETGNG